MKILVTGATGLVGTALCKLWQHEHQLVILTRSEKKAKQQLGDIGEIHSSLNTIDFNTLDAVVNLAGEPIADKRWSESRKTLICQSRWLLTEAIASKILEASTPPHTLINASAIGFYGRQSAERIDEGFVSFYPEFSHDVCARWENLAKRCQSESTRVCIMRIGIVLSENGGALGKMLPAFKLGLGGRIGSGTQMMSWIHIDDLVGAFNFVLSNSTVQGIFNATAPMAVSNLQWTQLLGARLAKKTPLPMPGFIVKLLFGEMSDLLLFGQNVYPQKLLDSGFQFKYNQLRSALASLSI